MWDIESALEPLSAQIADLEEDIESIVRRNEVVDAEVQGMKTDFASLSDKILAIKVSFLVMTLEFISRKMFMKKHDHF